jgi:hypothetical protein
MAETVKYSSLLQDFVAPICTDDETEESFYQKCQIGMQVWNLAIANKYDLAQRQTIQNAIDAANARQPDMRFIVSLLLEHKQAYFSEHNELIVDLKVKTLLDGGKSLVAYTVPIEAIPGR